MGKVLGKEKMNQGQEISEKIFELRKRYAKLKAICGPRGVSEETIIEYAKIIKKLQEELN